MSRDENAGAQGQCEGCDQARSCWIRDTLECLDAPGPSAIAVEERYVERAEGMTDYEYTSLNDYEGSDGGRK